eukprot:356550-Chlamydomonas_euryale.AAC.3
MVNSNGQIKWSHATTFQLVGILLTSATAWNATQTDTDTAATCSTTCRASETHNVVVVEESVSREHAVEIISKGALKKTGDLQPGDLIVLTCQDGGCGPDNNGKYYTGQVIAVEL